MRVKSLKKEMEKINLDGYMLMDIKNIYYFTGFMDVPGANLCLIISTNNSPVLLIQTLSHSAAYDQTKECIIRTVDSRDNILNKIIENITKLKLKRVGFDNISVFNYKELKRKMKNRKFIQAKEPVWNLRKIKSEKEIEYINKAAKLADRGLEAGIEAVKPGVHEYEVAAEIEYAMRIRGSEGIAFETVVASGPRSAYPHGVSSERKILKGEFVILDLGAVCKGYRSDVTRTVVTGRPTTKQKRLIDTVLKAQEEAFYYIRDGEQTKDVDKIARKIIEKSGYGKYFIHGLGHGVGLDIHEPPTLSKTSKDVLQEGNVITNEPGIYIKDFGGVRIEDTVLVKMENGERLTKSPRTLY